MGTPLDTITVDDLPGLDCGLCGFRSCSELAARLATQPDLLQRCIHLSDHRVPVTAGAGVSPVPARAPCGPCPLGDCAMAHAAEPAWRDTLGREFDFYLEHFPTEPGPREIILPHNPLLTREMGVEVGDILIGRPLGMSCGCPITHCGVAMQVDHRTGVIVWCVTGPLRPRQQGYKDLGYYIAEGYEGVIKQSNVEVKIGMRYFFQPRMCMLQWRHSGLVNFLNRTPDGLQVRLEGLWIG
jgi:uncharacterized Fe-S cluster-containing protein